MRFTDYLFFGVMFAMVINAFAIHDHFKGLSRLTLHGLIAYCFGVSLLSIGASIVFWWIR